MSHRGNDALTPQRRPRLLEIMNTEIRIVLAGDVKLAITLLVAVLAQHPVRQLQLPAGHVVSRAVAATWPWLVSVGFCAGSSMACSRRLLVARRAPQWAAYQSRAGLQYRLSSCG